MIDMFGSRSLNPRSCSRFVERLVRLTLPRLANGAPQRGQALLEMALVLPLIMVFILALVDFGIAIDRREVLQHAVYEGSRKAIPGATVQEIKDRTVAQSKGLLTDADITVCYIDSDLNGDISAGDDVRVSANYAYNFTVGGDEVLGFWGVTPPSIALTPKAEGRLANGPLGSEPACS